jgi:Na+-transporting methylmalonyl-CoA/oxaloacetate decarboxylase gamma subunit
VLAATVTIALIGMLVVFLFLSLLVLLLTAMGFASQVLFLSHFTTSSGDPEIALAVALAHAQSQRIHTGTKERIQ